MLASKTSRQLAGYTQLAFIRDSEGTPCLYVPVLLSSVFRPASHFFQIGRLAILCSGGLRCGETWAEPIKL